MSEQLRLQGLPGLPLPSPNFPQICPSCVSFYLYTKNLETILELKANFQLLIRSKLPILQTERLVPTGTITCLRPHRELRGKPGRPRSPLAGSITYTPGRGVPHP